MHRTGTSLTAVDVRALEDQHHKLLDLCLALEELASELEAGETPAEIATVGKCIEPLVLAAHSLEEQRFYPDLKLQATSCFGSMLLDQIKAEHRFDRRAARELSLTLIAVAEQRCQLNLPTVAFMVRAFQEAVRRHVMAEQLLLEHLLQLEPDEKAELV